MKRIIAMLLCLVMVLGCFAGCNNDKPVETQPKETKPAETQPKETQPAETEPPKYQGELPLVAEETVITIGIPQNDYTTDYVNNDYTKWIEEQTGVKLEFVYFSNDSKEQVTQLNLMISGNEELPDILWGFAGVGSALRNELGEDGYILDMLPLLEEYGYYTKEMIATAPEAAQKNIIMYGQNPGDGCLYGFPAYQQAAMDTVYTHAFINQKWLDAIGEKMPTTVDELYTVLKKFATEDPNGNGKADEIALLGSDSRYRADIVSFIINAFVYCCDSQVYNATDGKVWLPYVTDEYRQAMIYLNKLYSEGLLSPLYYSFASNPELTAMNTPADGVPLVGVTAGHNTVFYEKDNPVYFEYTPLKPLKAATELGGYAPLAGDSYEYSCFITEDAEDPVLAFKLLDFMTCQEARIRARYGNPGEHWEWNKNEGEVYFDGSPANITLLDGDIYAAQNAVNWHQVRGQICTFASCATAAVVDDTWNGYRNKNNIELYQIHREEGLQPEEVVYKLLYTAEEDEVKSEYQKPLTSYIKEARAMFLSGTLDPNNDADWNTYLNTVKEMGCEELLTVAQSAYTRMLENAQ